MAKIHELVRGQLEALDMYPRTRKQIPTLPTFRYSLQWERNGQTIKGDTLEVESNNSGNADREAMFQMSERVDSYFDTLRNPKAPRFDTLTLFRQVPGKAPEKVRTVNIDPEELD